MRRLSLTSERDRRNIILLLFTLPALVIYTAFFLLPIVGNAYLSLFDWNGGNTKMRFVGLDNFIRLLTDDKEFASALWHNAVYMVTVVLIQLTLALIFALILAKKLWGGNFFKTIFLLPVVLSNVTLALVWSYMFDPMNGFLNSLLQSTGLSFLTRNWLGDPGTALFSIAFVNSWQYVGYSMVIFIAGLLTIPESLYEAADIDGASRFRKFIHVTVPLLMPAIMMNVVLATTGSLKVFDLIYIITPPGGPVSSSTEVLGTLIYKIGFTYGEMGYASAVSLVLLIVIMIVGFVQIRLFRAKDIGY
ncbi:sugar ABC transporter permease [Paenibacillus sp. sptzw28]|uniref:carbohydrate ABC transporter permease n=1 Tax=Paenibacillus sp. sptzw28 TaxID=715179 RepID=UPI001C6E4260|nr:sugar ABC transporter permease [Paenibacillus sp. sptzw28]QYR21024.1 sugar ABC transporter permease [Paenibacillus sp. sptzw28]